uniref:DDE-1 domain-containing protein n=1 Tax=Acrobeloides nanus TaxID=290746 RepID=A0A914D0Y4_9BILA
MDAYLEWVCKAWQSIPVDAIVASFKTCGITNAFDGSEDGMIHCFKPHGPIPAGRTLLDNARGAQNLVQLVEEIDLNENEHNGY